jgi:hypothetical protein
VGAGERTVGFLNKEWLDPLTNKRSGRREKHIQNKVGYRYQRQRYNNLDEVKGEPTFPGKYIPTNGYRSCQEQVNQVYG